MGSIRNYGNLEDFIGAAKKALRDEDQGMNTVFFDINYDSQAVRYRQGEQEFDGQKMTAKAIVSAISNDGIEFIIHQQEIGALQILPQTTKEHINEFKKQMDTVLNSNFVQIVEDKFESSDRRRGSCGPTVA
jgi:hypothetical protein